MKVAIIDDVFSKIDYNYIGRGQTYVSHGTLCENVFKISSHSADVICVPSSKRGGVTMVEDLVYAIECAEKKEVDIIIMSVGTTNKLLVKNLEKCVNRLNKKGVLLVCAVRNDNVITYPAAFPGVIAVRHDETDLLNEGEFRFVENPIDGVDIIYCTPISQLGHIASYEDRTSNSVAAPFFAGWLYRVASDRFGENIDRKVVKDILKVYSSPVKLDFDYYCSILTNKVRDERMLIVAEVFGDRDTSLSVMTQLVDFFEKDGYCIGLAGTGLKHEPHHYHFSFEELFECEKLGKNQVIRYIFSLAKIDALFIINDKCRVDEQLECSMHIYIGNFMEYIEPSMKISDNPTCLELEHLKNQFVDYFS